jgi:o-succinylbenzoate synthase
MNQDSLNKILKMNIRASWVSYQLDFKRPSGTSRGVLHSKLSYFLKITDLDKNITCIGEAGPLKGLSLDYNSVNRAGLELCDIINNSGELYVESLKPFPSLVFALEVVFMELCSGNKQELIKNSFSKGSGIPINGLIWMGDSQFMHEQIDAKLSEGYSCIKIKIGAIDFKKELSLLESIRNSFSADRIEIRVDANGAFDDDAADKLNCLSAFSIHSIEQPVRAGNWPLMKKLCSDNALDIALDEELIGVKSLSEKRYLLESILPQYIIIKPSLLGGFAESEEWIALAEELGIGWWITSALESNIGLNAIAQWTSSLNTDMYQGLGTGQLYTNNIESPLEISNAHLFYNSSSKWEMDFFR